MEPKYIVKRADLEYNIRVLRNLAKGKVIWGVVKGNGYGLGIVPLARILNDCGVDHLAVAPAWLRQGPSGRRGSRRIRS